MIKYFEDNFFICVCQILFIWPYAYRKISFVHHMDRQSSFVNKKSKNNIEISLKR